MKKIFHLSTCTTCQRILNEWSVPESVTLQDIKSDLYSEEELDKMKELAGSYEAIFSKRAMKYKEWNVKDKVKTDDDYREFLLKDYTFLKRPALVYEDTIFAGNSKKTVEAAGNFLASL
ncbi:arsenate reductase family protein [Wandonia haliotis]|uniref:arsenate reductase family protein n=1 Tax=Wandonia haliotis TaxID=574963 RepID=UPI0031D4A8F3